MKIISITVSISIPIQVAKYEILKPFVSLTGEIEEGDGVSECREHLYRQCMEMFVTQAQEEIAALGATKDKSEQYLTNEALAKVSRIL